MGRLRLVEPDWPVNPRLRDSLPLMKQRIVEEKKQTCENTKMPGGEAFNVVSTRQLSTEIEIWK